MNECRFIERSLESGHFDNLLSEIPRDVRDHLKRCERCREVYKILLMAESTVLTGQPSVLTPTARARIRMGVKEKREKAMGRWRWTFLNPVLGVLATALVVLILVRNPWDSRNVQQGLDPADLDIETAEMLLNYLDVPITYDETLELAILRQADSDLIATAVESWIWPAEDLYDETVLSGIAEFDDSDWDALRRYLI